MNQHRCRQCGLRIATPATPDISGVDRVMDDLFFDLADEIEHIDERQARIARYRAVRTARSKEAGLGLIASIVLSFPKISELVGRGINRLARFMSKRFGEGEVDETTAGRFLVQLGHKMEHTYVRVLEKALWVLSKTPIVNKRLDLDQVDEEDLHRVAKILFYAILIVAAGNAFMTAFGQFGSILGAIEGLLGGVKAGEVMAAVKSIVRST